MNPVDHYLFKRRSPFHEKAACLLDDTGNAGQPGRILPASAEEESVYTSLYSSEVSTLNYLTSSTTWDYTPGANVVDTLIEYNDVGEIIPGLRPETWEVSEDQLTWTLSTCARDRSGSTTPAPRWAKLPPTTLWPPPSLC